MTIIGSPSRCCMVRLNDTNPGMRSRAWKTSAKVGALRRGSGRVIVKTTRNFDTVLVVPLVSRLLRKTVSVAFERQEKVRVRGRKGGGACELAADDDGGGTMHTGTVQTVHAVALGDHTAGQVVATESKAFIALNSGSGEDVLPGVNEAQEKSSSPLEARRMVLGGDGADPATTTGFVMVSTTAVASSKGADIVVTALEALKKSVVAVVGEIGGNREIGGNGDETTTLVTVEVVLVESPRAPAAVDTAAKVQGAEEKSRSCAAIKKSEIAHHGTKIDSHIDYAVLPPHRHCPTLASDRLAYPRDPPSSPRRLRARRREGGAWLVPSVENPAPAKLGADFAAWLAMPGVP
ncbi:hypothetical protein EDD85DRAFT_795985 [Armillaria nabsnona]|nr:hypothetical protein EDD85DRAFT_795985 [Armillaria nabsnona]